jgi:hypothetical protein
VERVRHGKVLDVDSDQLERTRNHLSRVQEWRRS